MIISLEKQEPFEKVADLLKKNICPLCGEKISEGFLLYPDSKGENVKKLQKFLKREDYKFFGNIAICLCCYNCMKKLDNFRNHTYDDIIEELIKKFQLF